MTEQQNMLAEMVERFFAELMAAGMPASAAHASDDPAWASLQQLGLCDIFLAEKDGGFGGTWQDAFVVFNQLGAHALPLPLGETIVAKKLLLDAGMDCPNGAITLGCSSDGVLTDGGQRLNASVDAVPWGNYASHMVLALANSDELVLVETAAATQAHSYNNEANEPRCDLVFDNAPVLHRAPQAAAVAAVMSAGALLRCCQSAGALASALAMSVSYVNERVQFGRPLSKFQAVQHQLAILAEEAAAVNCAAKAASLRADVGEAFFEVAASKLRANRAVTKATSIAHQAHGAIGFTQEHQLHFFTQRLWAWRSEFGNDRYWAQFLGRQVLAAGADNFWSDLTARSDSD